MQVRLVTADHISVVDLRHIKSDHADKKGRTVDPVRSTLKPVLSGHSQKGQKWVFKTNYCLMQVKSIAECSPWSILQYFRPTLSYHMALRPFYCIFLSGRLR